MKEVVKVFNRIQSLDNAQEKVLKHFKKHPTASISAMFKNLRKDDRISLIGDYPIISVIVTSMYALNLRVKRRNVFKALRQSQELKGKRVIINSLFSDN